MEIESLRRKQKSILRYWHGSIKYNVNDEYVMYLSEPGQYQSKLFQTGRAGETIYQLQIHTKIRVWKAKNERKIGKIR